MGAMGLELPVALAACLLLAYLVTVGLLTALDALEDRLRRRRWAAPDPLTRLDVVALAADRQRLSLDHGQNLVSKILP